MKKVAFFCCFLMLGAGLAQAQGWYGSGPRWMYNSTETMYFGDLQAGGQGFSFCYSLKDTGGLEIWPANVYTKGSWSFDKSVAIGIAAPVQRLHVNSTNTQSYATFTHSTSGATSTDGLLVGLGGTTGFIWNYETGSLNFGTDGSFRMAVTSTGDVGIGTSSPTAKLGVNYDSTVDDPQLELYETASNDFARINFRNGSSATGNKNFYLAGMPSANDSDAVFNIGYESATNGLQDTFQVFGNDIAQVSSAYASSIGGLFNVVGEYSGNVDTKGIYVTNEPADYYGYGVYAKTKYISIFGSSQGTGSNNYYAVRGSCNGTNTGTNYGVYGYAAGATTNWAGFFSGNARVTGTFDNSKSVLRIDNPKDPENSYLYHDTIVSNEMKTVYDGTVILDKTGQAVVVMPDYIQSLNRSFRYQLTCIGGWAPVYIAQKLNNNRFIIAGGDPGMEISWQVTGIRDDAYARQHPTKVEVEKAESEKGYYIDPEAFGMGPEMGIENHREELEIIEKEEMAREAATQTEQEVVKR